MTPFMCHSQPTPCAYKGALAKGSAPRPRTEIRRVAAPGSDPAVDVAGAAPGAGGHDGPAGGEHQAAGERCHPAVRLVKPRRARLLHFVPALAGDEPAAGPDGGSCGRTQASGPQRTGTTTGSSAERNSLSGHLPGMNTEIEPLDGEQNKQHRRPRE